MAQVVFDVTATRAYSAKLIKYVLEGPVALIAVGLALVLLAFEDARTHTLSHLVVGIAMMAFVFIIVRKFVSDILENDNQKPLKKTNAACLLSFNVLKNLKQSATTAYDLLVAVVDSPRAPFILHEMGLDKERLLDIARPELSAQLVIPVIAEASQNMAKFGERKLDAGVLLYTLFQRPGVFEQLLNSLDLSVADMEMIVKWESYHHAVWKHDRPFSPAWLVTTFGGMGRRWVMGYNDLLDAITEDISQNILYRANRKVTIHLDKLKDAMRILNRSSQHNMIVTGDDGSGKKSFIDNIAYVLRLEQSKKGYSYTRVLKLKAEDLLSGATDPDTVLLQALKKANSQGHFILVIENIGLFLQSSNSKTSGVLSKFLQAKHINIIGIADTKDYHKYVKTNPALDSQFEKIQLEPTSFGDTMSVLMEEYFSIEDSKHTHVTYKALRAIIELADRYITKGAFPGKAIDLLHEAVAYAKERHDTYVTESDVREMVSLRAHMDVTGADDKQKDILLHLEERMQDTIVGQQMAITAIANALKRASADITNRQKPIGTFLFVGPTGVGKTQTAKSLATEYFGSSENMIRMDMNEYSNEDSIYAVIGSTDPRYPNEGYLTRAVQDKPFSLILLDEIEKADKKVLNLFLQILDEGHLIDGQGVKTDFRNTIIIATSNAGAQFIVDFLRQHPSPDQATFKKALLDELIKTGMYSPEFLNRFDEVVLYMPLSKEETIRVASMMIGAIIKDLEESKGIAVQITEDAVAAIAQKGYSQDFGVREMRRAITDTLETYVADYMLRHEVKRGTVIQISKDDLKL